MSSVKDLAQLLLPAEYPSKQLERALESANQDITRAAEILLLGIGPSTSKRGDLGAWLKPKVEDVKRKRKNSVWRPDVSESRKRRDGEPKVKVDEPIILSSDEEDFRTDASISKPSNATSVLPPTPQPPKLLSLSTLQQAPSPPRRNKAQPPIRLTTPQAISSTLPCSLIPSPLSPEFATALYLSLVEESRKEEIIEEDGKGNKVISQQGFRRHKWFLNGREVVSPHTSGYYRLSEEEGGVESGGEYCKWNKLALVRSGVRNIVADRE